MRGARLSDVALEAVPRPSAGSRSHPLTTDSGAVDRLRAADRVMARLIDDYGAPHRVLARPRPTASGAVDRLRAADRVRARLIDDDGAPEGVLARRGRRPGDAYGALLRSIVGQQLSTKAARTIYERLTDLFGGHAPTPAEL